MRKAEKIIAVIAITSLGLNLFLVTGGGAMTVLTLFLLSLIYMIFGFAIFNKLKLRDLFNKESYNEISPKRIIGAVGAGLALSTTTIGLLYKIQGWTGASVQLGTGIVCLVAVMIISIIKNSKNKSDYYRGIIKRCIIFSSLGVILLLLPEKAWTDFKYRNHPTYLKALEKASADPDNDSLWKKVDEERTKMK